MLMPATAARLHLCGKSVPGNDAVKTTVKGALPTATSKERVLPAHLEAHGIGVLHCSAALDKVQTVELCLIQAGGSEGDSEECAGISLLDTTALRLLSMRMSIALC